jgi:anthranilate/para-aminobenzoate synthase component I
VTKDQIFTIIPYKNQLIRIHNPSRARIIYKNRTVDLISEDEYPANWTEWFNEYSFSIEKKIKTPRVTHFFYELGFLIEDQNKIEETTILAIDIEYQRFSSIVLNESQNKINLNLFKTINFDLYKKLFNRGRKELLAGNCYQFNLTCNHWYNWKKDYTVLDFIAALWSDPAKRGAYGSATYIPNLEMLYLSNSPECLFQLDNNILSTMPIKGTLALKSMKDLKVTWKKLIQDKKNESELFMIIDLLRNDLARIELPRAKVVNKKLPLIVPGLLHQYAKIEVELSKMMSVKNILEKVFPGGSVTGAPKKSALRILFGLEKKERGFYCGSTLICFKKMKVASINIRSAEIDLRKKKLLYQSGGGITLQSNAREEFEEMLAKRMSFIRAL